MKQETTVCALACCHGNQEIHWPQHLCFFHFWILLIQQIDQHKPRMWLSGLTKQQKATYGFSCCRQERQEQQLHFVLQLHFPPPWAAVITSTLSNSSIATAQVQRQHFERVADQERDLVRDKTEQERVTRSYLHFISDQWVLACW